MFNFNSISKDITKDFILSKLSQETILEYYLGVKITNKNIKSPLRKDNKPTCSFYKTRKGDIYFHDFGTGLNVNWLSLVMYKYNCSYKVALKKIANDFKLNNEKVNLKEIIQSTIKLDFKEKSKINIEYKDFTDKDLEWWIHFISSINII